MSWQDRIAEFELANPQDDSGKRVSDKLDPYDIIRARNSAHLHWCGISEDDLDKNYPLRSQVYAALSAINRAAFEAANRPDGTLDEDRYTSLQHDGSSVIQGIYANLRWSDDKERKGEAKHRLWSHRNSAFPEFDRTGIEAAVSEYLALPYRVPEIDRLLIDLLLAMEIAAFAKSIRGHIILWLVEVPFLGWGTLEVWRIWPWAGYLAAFAFIAWLWWFPIRTIVRASSLTVRMRCCYEAMNSSGPISAQHIRDLLNSSAGKGIMWPAPIYALIDDVIARGGRL